MNKHNTEDCYYKITDNGDGNYIITAVVSKDFLNSKETVYPVIVDPSVVLFSNYSGIEDTYVNQASPNSNYASLPYLQIGNNNGKLWSYIKYTSLPSINPDYIIVDATIEFKFRPGQTTSAIAKIGGITTKTWNTSTITWNSRVSWDGYNTTSDHHNCSYYKFNITDLVYDWYAGNCPNYGMVFTYKDQNYCDYNILHSTEASANDGPLFTIILSNKDTYYNGNYDYSNYNRNAAANYAINNSVYPQEGSIYIAPGYISTDYSVTNSISGKKPGDCTNFASQCLVAGGMEEIKGSESDLNAWYYAELFSKYYNASDTWGSVEFFCKHWGHTPDGYGKQHAYSTIIYHDLHSALSDWDYISRTIQKGDVIQFCKSGEFIHTIIIHDVNKTTKTIYYAQQSMPLKNQNLETKLKKFYKDNIFDKIIIHKF